MRYISSEISSEVFAAQPGSIILIQAPPGYGKTTFVLKDLLNYCKRENKNMLCLFNRNALKGQVKQKLLKDYKVNSNSFLVNFDSDIVMDSIVVTSYQHLQHLISKSINKIGGIKFGHFDFVVADEIHYLFTDSLFSGETVYLNKIHELFGNAIRIYISATLKPVKEAIFNIERIEDLYPNGEIQGYQISSPRVRFVDACSVLKGIRGYATPRNVLIFDKFQPDYSYLRPHYLGDRSDVVELILKKRSEGDTGKWLIFVDSKVDGDEITSRLKQNNVSAAFVYSGAKKSEERAEFDNLVKKRKFSSTVLCCTNVLDNGVSIEDIETTHILLNAFESIQAIQQLGRVRRIKKGQVLNVYFRRYSLEIFNRKRYALYQKLKMYSLYDQNDKRRIIEFWENNSYVTNDGIGIKDEVLKTWTPNIFCKESLEYHIAELDDDMNRIKADPDGYLKKSLEWFGLQYRADCDILIQQSRETKIELISFLNKHLELDLDDTKWRDVRDKIRGFYEKETGKSLCSGRKDRTPGIGQIKEILEEYEFTVETKNKMHIIRRKQK